MQMDVAKMLGEYGILSMGWVVAALLWFRLVTVEDKFHEALKDNTAAITELLSRLK